MGHQRTNFSDIMNMHRSSEGLIWVCIGLLGMASLVSQIMFQKSGSLVDSSLELTVLPMTEPRSNSDRSKIDVVVEKVEQPTCEERSFVQAQAHSTVVDLFLDAIIEIESGRNPRVVGHAGERGLMQIKQATWAEVTRKTFGKPIQFDRAFEPGLNVVVGKAYLHMLQAFLHEHQAKWNSDHRSLLLACYNAGPGAVRGANFDIRLLPRSTQEYVERATSLHDFYLINERDYTARVDTSRKSQNVL